MLSCVRLTVTYVTGVVVCQTDSDMCDRCCVRLTVTYVTGVVCQTDSEICDRCCVSD